MPGICVAEWSVSASGPGPHSARHQRGSIAAAVLRCMRKRPPTRTAAEFEGRIDVAAFELAAYQNISAGFFVQ